VNRGVLYYLIIPLLIIAGLFQSTAASRIEMGGVKPDLVLLLVVAGTLIYGARSGVTWAFIGGICLDIFSGGPMGASSLALIAAAMTAGLGHRTLSRYNLLEPIGAIIAGTAIYSTVYLSILLLMHLLDVAQYTSPPWSTVQYVVMPAIAYNTAVMVFLMPLLNQVPESQDI